MASSLMLVISLWMEIKAPSHVIGYQVAHLVQIVAQDRLANGFGVPTYCVYKCYFVGKVLFWGH